MSVLDLRDRSIAAVISLGLLVTFALPAHAQDDASGDNPEVQYPAPARALILEGGYVWERVGDVTAEDSFYRIAWDGALVQERGTPATEAKALDLLAPALKKPAGDAQRLHLQVENSGAEVGGGLFEAEGLHPLTLRGLERLKLRGSAFLGADTDFNHVVASVGLESRPIRIPGAHSLGASNWIVLGLNGQRNENPDEPEDDAETALATYRAFLGRAFGWRTPANWGAAAEEVTQKMLAQAPTVESAKAVVEEIEKIKAADRSSVQQLLVDAFEDMGADEDWPTKLREIALGDTEAFLTQPTISMYLESSGWYDFESSATDHFKSLTTFTTDYWPQINTDGFFVRLRYEYGFERAVPDVKKNRVMISAALRY